ncbi:hypothetical protein PIB30_069707 [Stylosanthes scabra]|uniref:Uncharacterized protein n=1 Tax=Stylosanthes scabra TaxID=79078 RepID=A0ABU6TMY4_9FABA|nr:hypothetical protein [Stylosanthes scabra]
MLARMAKALLVDSPHLSILVFTSVALEDPISSSPSRHVCWSVKAALTQVRASAISVSVSPFADAFTTFERESLRRDMASSTSSLQSAEREEEEARLESSWMETRRERDKIPFGSMALVVLLRKEVKLVKQELG